ncbi:MAG: GNAT family N-acetyltransferase, partial [Elusimicrobia bacterium]|nr:GNAT family N-acetyltransferase [Elusimicrobiota bacterium]
MVISTRRLDLVAATLEHLVAEVDDRGRLGRMLGASVPADWPPPLNDEHSQRFFMEALRERPGAVGWFMWYFVQRAEPRTVVGNGGFKGEPVDGTVELGYSVIPDFQRSGFASEAADALVNWAFRDSRVQRVVAETFPDLEGS